MKMILVITDSHGIGKTSFIGVLQEEIFDGRLQIDEDGLLKGCRWKRFSTAGTKICTVGKLRVQIDAPIEVCRQKIDSIGKEDHYDEEKDDHHV